MMHCTMEDLGALQAGEASVWARRHITTCAACQAELEGLYQRIAQLKALPALRPPRDRWPAVKSALRVQREQSAQDAELLQLWQERVGLMRELMNARATRARYVGL